MKKIITVLTLLLAFTISANAQDKNISPEAAAKRDSEAAQQNMNLTSEQQKALYKIMLIKHEALADPLLTAEGKKEMYNQIDMDLKKAISNSNYNYLFKNPDLRKQLLN